MQASPARTLSKQQFLAQRPHGDYANYLSYVASRRKQLAQGGGGKTMLDPSITNLLSLLPSPNSPAFAPTPPKVLTQQASAYATAATKPVIDQLNASYDKRATAGAQAIKGFYGVYGNRLAGAADQVHSVYQGQAADEAALNGALAQFQGAQGEQGATDLASALKSIGGPGMEGDVANAQALGHNLTATGAAAGANDLSRVLNEGASQQSLAAMLPGIAALQGGQRTSELEASLNSDLSDRVGQVTAQVPGLVQDYLQNAQTREDQKAQFRAGLASDRGKLGADLFSTLANNDTQKAIAAAGFNVDYAKLNEMQGYHDASVNARLQAIAAQNTRAAAHERATNARTAATISAQNQRATLKASGLTQKDVNRLISESVKYGTSVRVGPTNPLTGLPDTTQAVTVRGTAYNRIYSWWKSRMPSASKATLDKLSNQTLNQAGYPAKKK